MMKKHYYAPSIKVAKVELQELIVASAQITPPSQTSQQMMMPR